MATERFNHGWTDPRGIFGQDSWVVTYEVHKEHRGNWEPCNTYSVVKVTRTTTKPYTKEPLYTGLSEEAAKGYVKLLTQPEDG
jgi:hypothetical protein